MAQLLGIVFRRKTYVNPCYLFVDEMQLLASRTISSILAETRKQKLFLVGATQSLLYFNEKLKNQLSTNTSVQLIGTTHPQDVQSLTRYWNLPKGQVSSLKKHQFLLKYEEKPPKIMASPSWLAKGNPLLLMDKNEIKKRKADYLKNSTHYRVKNETVFEKIVDSKRLKPKFNH